MERHDAGQSTPIRTADEIPAASSMNTDLDEVEPVLAGASGRNEKEDGGGGKKGYAISLILGHVVWLMMQSPTHKHLFLADLEWLVIPPILKRQFRVFTHDNVPFAWVSWGLLSETVAKRLLAGQRRLKPEEWQSGEQAWIIDVITPFGGVEGVLREVKKVNFPQRPLWLLNRDTATSEWVREEVMVK